MNLITRVFHNGEIYALCVLLNEQYSSETTLVLPVQLSFIIQYNKNELMKRVDIIEQERLKIGAKFGEYKEEQQGYFVPVNKRSAAEEELRKLNAIPQEIQIYEIPFSQLKDINLSMGQMEAILPFIKMDEE